MRWCVTVDSMVTSPETDIISNTIAGQKLVVTILSDECAKMVLSMGDVVCR